MKYRKFSKTPVQNEQQIDIIQPNTPGDTSNDIDEDLNKIFELFQKNYTESCTQPQIPHKRQRKRIWTTKQDKKLQQLLNDGHNIKLRPELHKLIPQIYPGVDVHDCIRHYHRKLKPGLKSGEFSAKEDMLLQELHKKYPGQWTLIAEQMGTRSDVQVLHRIKYLNRFNK